MITMPRPWTCSDLEPASCPKVSDSPLPVPRAEHGALVDPAAQVAYIVGGHDDRGQILSTCADPNPDPNNLLSCELWPSLLLKGGHGHINASLCERILFCGLQHTPLARVPAALVPGDSAIVLMCQTGWTASHKQPCARPAASRLASADAVCACALPAFLLCQRDEVGSTAAGLALQDDQV